MITIVSQPLGKNYMSHVLSRSFFVSYFCYILVLIITATILININYSWPEYQRVMILPKVSQLYQQSCSSSDTISVGVQQNQLSIMGQVKTVPCIVQIYLNVFLGQSTNFVAYLPINLQNGSAILKGTISFKSSKPLPQSSIITIDETQLTNFQDSASKTIHLDSKILYQKLPTTSTSYFKADFQILGGMFMQEVSLIDKLRTFIPIFMYISIFLWWIIVNPLIDWMLRNRVYSAKMIPQKIKQD